jgi:hypothetical protein
VYIERTCQLTRLRFTALLDANSILVVLPFFFINMTARAFSQRMRSLFHL